MSNKNFLIHEYQECNNNLRHYSNMRFAEFTIFFVINAVLLNLISGGQKPPEPWLHQILCIMGLFFAVALFIMNKRQVSIWESLYKRAVKIEEILEYDQHKKRPKKGIFNNRNTAAAIYTLFGLLWILIAFITIGNEIP